MVEENAQCVSYKLCSWQRCLWQWVTGKICFLPRQNVFYTQIKVNCLKLFARSSVQSITLCNWDGLQQQVEQCNRSRSIEQKNWSWGSDIYAIHISAVLDRINSSLFHGWECTRCAPRLLSPHLVQLERIQVLSETTVIHTKVWYMGKVGDRYKWKAHSWYPKHFFGTFCVGLVWIVTWLNKSSLKIKKIVKKWQIKK